MKGVPIKFRGKSIKDNSLMYGDLMHYDEYISIRYQVKGKFEFVSKPVYPDSVSQLVGYDANGEEIYEGDILCAPYGEIKNFSAGVAYLQTMCDDFGTKITLTPELIKNHGLILKKC